MICPCLTYLDLPAALTELQDHFGLDVVWLGDDTAEIRCQGGVAVAHVDRPDDLHGTHVGHGWTYVQVDDPDTHCARALERGARVLNAPHSTPDGRQRGYTARDREGNLWTFAVAAFGRGVPGASA